MNTIRSIVQELASEETEGLIVKKEEFISKWTEELNEAFSFQECCEETQELQQLGHDLSSQKCYYTKETMSLLSNITAAASAWTKKFESKMREDIISDNIAVAAAWTRVLDKGRLMRISDQHDVIELAERMKENLICALREAFHTRLWHGYNNQYNNSSCNLCLLLGTALCYHTGGGQNDLTTESKQAYYFHEAIQLLLLVTHCNSSSNILKTDMATAHHFLGIAYAGERRLYNTGVPEVRSIIKRNRIWRESIIYDSSLIHPDNENMVPPGKYGCIQTINQDANEDKAICSLHKAFHTRLWLDNNNKHKTSCNPCLILYTALCCCIGVLKQYRIWRESITHDSNVPHPDKEDMVLPGEDGCIQTINQDAKDDNTNLNAPYNNSKIQPHLRADQLLSSGIVSTDWIQVNHLYSNEHEPNLNARYDRAIQSHFHTALSIRTDFCGEAHSLVTDTKEGLGHANYEQYTKHGGDTQSAIQLIEEALQIRINGLCSKTAMSLNQLGKLYCNEGDYKRAISTFEHLLRIQKSYLESDYKGLVTEIGMLKKVCSPYLLSEIAPIYEKAKEFCTSDYGNVVARVTREKIAKKFEKLRQAKMALSYFNCNKDPLDPKLFQDPTDVRTSRAKIFSSRSETIHTSFQGKIIETNGYTHLTINCEFPEFALRSIKPEDFPPTKIEGCWDVVLCNRLERDERFFSRLVFHEPKEENDSKVFLKLVSRPNDKNYTKIREDIDALQYLGDDKHALKLMAALKYKGSLFIVTAHYQTFVELFPISCPKSSMLYFGQLLNCLRHLKEKCLCHGDICPKNIVIRDGRCILTGLGGYRQGHSCSFNQGTSIRLLFHDQGRFGSPRYMAPEIYFRHPNGIGFDGFAVDLWSVGVVLWEMMMGNDGVLPYTPYWLLEDCYYDADLKFKTLDSNTRRLLGKILRLPSRRASLEEIESEITSYS